MSQLWQIRQTFRGRLQKIEATVSEGDRQSEFPLLSYSFSGNRLAIEFYPKVDQLRIHQNNVFLDGLMVRGASYEVHCHSDELTKARIGVRVDSINESLEQPIGSEDEVPTYIRILEFEVGTADLVSLP